MKRFAIVLAASTLSLSGLVSAAEPLTAVEMDGITAGSNLAASALATAFGNTTYANTLSNTSNTVTGQVVLPEGGKVQQILGTAIAQSAAGADGQSAAVAQAGGAVIGDSVADSTSSSNVVADSLTPMSYAAASNNSAAVSIVRGWSAQAASSSTASSSLVLH